MINQRFWITTLTLVCLGIYLLVSAPPPLSEESRAAAIPVEKMFEILEAQNDAVRALWTQEIVGEGKKVGLKFDEHWRDPDLDAGPLPALFLRETAKSLEKDPVPLSLFLGSDYPINPANRFEGLQLEKFRLLKADQKPQFFYTEDTRLYTALFPDLAVSQVCVECHNRHEHTPKTDWQLNEVMGATTWMYPKASVSLEEMLEVISALERGFREAYAAYLKKVESFARPPKIGERWPREGYFLPSLETFMAEVLRRTSPQTLKALQALGEKPKAGASS